MEAKKISFGFSKTNKKLNLLQNKKSVKDEAKIELIKCLEGQEIKLLEEKPKELPLIIPLKGPEKTSTALASLKKRRAVLLGEEETELHASDNKVEETSTATIVEGNEDIEKRAARELLAEIQSNSVVDSSSNLVLPVVKPDDLPLEGAKEPTLDDYESIPIQDFGKAMLRGMGWKEPPNESTKSGLPKNEQPMVRPKGMGLGADKALKPKPLLVAPETNEVLEVKLNAYVRILGGKHKDLYGQIEGFDDHAGRVIVKMAIGGVKETFNEFLCQPVSRKEYAQYGKCINTTKYEEYKKKDNEHGHVALFKEEKERKDMGMKDRLEMKTKEYEYSGNNHKYRNFDSDYERNRQSVTNLDVKKENNEARKTDHKSDKSKYAEKNVSKDEDKDRRKETSKNDIRYCRNERDRYREDEKHESKFYSHREDGEKYYRNYDEISYGDRQRSRDEHSHDQRSLHKKIKSDESSSDSKDDLHSSRHPKPKINKSSKKKSKKSKILSHSDSSDSETKIKKRNKKRKKNKKRRERSRSREKR